MFSPLQVFVQYQLNRYEIAVDGSGINAQELLQTACKRLQLSPLKHYLAKHGRMLNDQEVVSAFSSVDLCPFENYSKNVATMRQVLCNITLQEREKPQSEMLEMLTHQVYQEIVKYCTRLAFIRKSEAVIYLPSTLVDNDPRVPPCWLFILRQISKDLHWRVLESLKRVCDSEGLYMSVRGEEWSCDWSLKSTEMVMPRITGRDLMEMGYNVGKGDLFRTILNSLRGAIMSGQVSDQSVMAQREWVRQNFTK